ncbi:hypothetical protein Nepgr_011302 [Nepenthes gracilis]|uniref:Cytochrome P450 n=1 Tax=Nepenthes gracilis TaxID=150966 RepID=A0AAD3SF18_NEPGR|nr:hypothetical protein Nepgr_011302 [Nepenthes gracilis]
MLFFCKSDVAALCSSLDVDFVLKLIFLGSFQFDLLHAFHGAKTVINLIRVAVHTSTRHRKREMDLWSSIIYLLTTWIFIHYLRFFLMHSPFNPKRLPPGPLPFPIVGNIFKLGSKPHKSLAELAKAYGPVLALKLGYVSTIVISSIPMAKEVLQKHDASFSNRTVVDASTVLDHHQSSVVFLSPSTKWRNMWRVCNSYVFAISQLDASRELRRRKVQQLISHIDHCCKVGTTMNIGQETFDTTLNILSNIFFSVDLANPRSDSGREFKEIVWDMMVVNGTPNIADFFPLLKIIDPQRIRYRAKILAQKVITLFNTMIDERLQLRKQTGSLESNDVLDVLLSINQENSKELELSVIPHLLLDLFAAGTETTSSTIEWVMTELLRNPNELKRAQLELEEVLGKNNPMEEEDIGRLPYLQAIIKETLRLHPPLPFLVPRKVITDVEFCGYIIPKNARILVNVWAMGRDPNIWEKADLFDPKRFLGSHINFKGNDFELIPFGTGRRICPGLQLASRMLHLIVGSLIHSFNWKLDGLVPEKIDMDEKFAFTLQKAQSLTAIPSRVYL